MREYSHYLLYLHYLLFTLFTIYTIYTIQYPLFLGFYVMHWFNHFLIVLAQFGFQISQTD